MEKDRESYFFIDVQSRGYYPSYAQKFFQREHIKAMKDAIELDGVELMGYTTWGGY